MGKAERNLKLVEPKEFQRYLKRLSRKGGVADAVYREVINAIMLWHRGEEPKLPKTQKGETRIPNAVKYDLIGYYRLVVREHEGLRIPLMVGDHEEVDRWLDNNQGRDFTINTDSNRIQWTPTKMDGETTRAATAGADDAVPLARGPVLSRIPKELIATLGLSEATLRSLNDFAVFEEVEGERLWNLLNALPYPSEDHKNLVLQVVALIVQGQVEQACERIHLFNGRATTATAEPDAFVDAIESGANSDVMVDLSLLDPDEIRHHISADGFTDWMLFLHRDQKRMVEREYNGPARLLGVSGSGKTSVLVHRANALAKKYPQHRILIITLNSALARLLEHLTDSLCVAATRAQIQVSTIYDYCYRVVKSIDPSRLIERKDHRSGEDLDACWGDFMDKPHALQQAGPIIDALEAREDYVDARAYLLDELIWIRSGFGKNERERYLDCSRPGRGILLPKYDRETKPSNTDGGSLPADTRCRLLRLLGDYEEYMQVGGLLDEDGVSLEAFSLKGQITQCEELRARCVLVDEVQDLSTVELAVIAEIPTEAADGLFMTGDPVQKVFAKQHDLINAGIDIRGRGAVLRTNYRNTRQILEAAFCIIEKFRELSPVPESEILSPKYAFRDGPKPKLYECETGEEQMRLVMRYLGLLSGEELDTVCICCPSEATIEQFTAACREAGYKTHRIRGSSTRETSIAEGVKLSAFQDIKGYEFRYVFLVDLMDGELLPKGMPWEERWRIAFQVYVAMTRARDELIMSFIYNRSILLGPLQDTVDDALASEMLR